MPSYFHLWAKCPFCLILARHADTTDISQIHGQNGHLVRSSPSFPFVELLTIRGLKDADNLDYRHLGQWAQVPQNGQSIRKRICRIYRDQGGKNLDRGVIMAALQARYAHKIFRGHDQLESIINSEILVEKR